MGTTCASLRHDRLTNRSPKRVQARGRREARAKQPESTVMRIGPALGSGRIRIDPKRPLTATVLGVALPTDTHTPRDRDLGQSWFTATWREGGLAEIRYRPLDFASYLVQCAQGLAQSWRLAALACILVRG